MMLVKKLVKLEFADPKIRASEHIKDIRKAAEAAGLNLFSRYGVRLQYPMVSKDGLVLVEVGIPEEIADSFALGNHLRGIANYLLKNCTYEYSAHLIGKRLLNYDEVPVYRDRTKGPSMESRLEAIVAFARLLERSDDIAMNRLSRILSILAEEQNSEVK